MSLIFTEHPDHKGRICESGCISDYTLCGITLDGDPNTGGSFKTTSKKINCSMCISIIEYCHNIKKSEITKGKQFL